VYEAGEHDGLPYLALEFCPNGSLAARLKGTPLPADEAAGLVETLARAVHHAHQAGVVHRDLKPGNVLLAADGTPKITDFGLAKRVGEDRGDTRSGTLVGTPSYMAPEQARGTARAAGPAADVYALGAVLYELLTGRPPFRAENACETLIQVVHHDPVSPRQLQPRLPRDLATVTLKCLEKDPKKRYPSAADLADDLRRFLDRRPTAARPVGPGERLSKWARRSPAVAGLMASVAAITVVGFALVFWQWTRAEDKAAAAAVARDDEAAARRAAERNERREAEARREVEQVSARLLIEQGAVRCERGDVGPGLLFLARGLERAVLAGDAAGERLARLNLAAWEPHFIAPRAELRHQHNVPAVAFRADGRAFATGSIDGVIGLWDPAGAPLRAALQAAPDRRRPVWALAFRPDGQVLLTGCGHDEGAGDARLWDLASGRDLGAVTMPSKVMSVAFAPDGTRFLAVCKEEARLWRADTLEPASDPLRHPGGVTGGVFSADGRTVLTGGADKVARLWDAATGRVRAELKGHRAAVQTVALSPDGRLAATGGVDGLVRLWDADTGEPRGRPMPHQGPVRAVAFSPDGQSLATGTMHVEPDYAAQQLHAVGGEARVWDLDGRMLGKPLPHPGPVRAVALTRGGRLLLTGCEDAHARFFLAGSGAQVGQPLRHEGTVNQVAFAPDGTAALTSSHGGGPGLGAAGRLWAVSPALAQGYVLGWGEDATTMAFSRDSRLMVVGYRSGKARLHEADTGRPLGGPLAHPGPVWGVAVSPDGSRLATGCDDGAVRLWDRDGRLLHTCRLSGPVSRVGFDPDGRTVVGVNGNGPAGRWSVADGRPAGPALPDVGRFKQLMFDADGQTAWTLDDDHMVRRRDLGSGEVSAAWRLPAWGSVGFAPDGRSVLTCPQHGRLIQRRDARTGRPEGPQMAHPDSEVWALAVSADGALGLSGSQHGSARLWDLGTGQAVGRLPQHHSEIRVTAFRPDGRMLALAGPGAAYLWPVTAPAAGTPEQVRLRVELLTRMRRDDDLTRDLSAGELDQAARRLRQLE
jgi:WD40 repeat protein